MKRIIDKIKNVFQFKIEEVILIDEFITIKHIGNNKIKKWIFFKFIHNIIFKKYKDDTLFKSYNVSLFFISNQKTLKGESVKFKIDKYDNYEITKLFRNSNNIEILIQYKFNNILSYYFNVTKLFSSNKNVITFLSDKHINDIKDLIKRIENLPDYYLANNKNKFSKEEVLNIIKKYSDVDNYLIDKLESIGINFKLLLYYMYINLNEKSNDKIITSPAILFINNKKMKDQPINVNNGFVITGKTHKKILSKNKRNKRLEHVKGFITDDNFFINEGMAINLVKKTGQVKNIEINIEDLKNVNIEDLINYDKNRQS